MKTNTALLLILILLVAGIGYLLFDRLPRGSAKPISPESGREKCLENQSHLELGIMQWAVDNNKSDHDFAPTRHDFICPSAGRYIIGTVGETPRCSLSQHARSPKQQ